MIRTPLTASLTLALLASGALACSNAEGGGIVAVAGSASGLSAQSTTQTVATPKLKEGDAAPEFTLTADDGAQVKLSDYKGKQPVVLYFYPKDETPGCTKQACAFRDSLADYRKAGIEVFGISVDTVAAHQAFKKNQKLNFRLLADADKQVSAAYGVLSERGYASRTTFLVGKDGQIKRVFEKVDPALNAAEVLAFAKTLE